MFKLLPNSFNCCLETYFELMFAFHVVADDKFPLIHCIVDSLLMIPCWCVFNKCIYVSFCVHLYLCICICVFVFVYLCICICVFVFIFVNLYLCLYIFVFAFVSLYFCIMYLCIMTTITVNYFSFLIHLIRMSFLSLEIYISVTFR